MTSPAQRDLKKLSGEQRPRIVHALRTLEIDPRRGAEKLAATDAYRVRVGDFRIVFRVDDAAREVVVARIAHRREVYRRR